MTGIQNAAVLPDPVLALASMSFPSSASGMAFSWIGVGSDQPSCEIAWACKVITCMKGSQNLSIVVTRVEFQGAKMMKKNLLVFVTDSTDYSNIS